MKMNHPIDLGGFIQVAIIVEDIEKSANEWAELFGVPVPEIIDQPRPQEPSDDLLYRGEPADYALKLAIIHAPAGFIIELHQCDENNSSFREYVKRHGYGVHHLGFSVGEKRDEIIGELEQRGYVMRTTTKDKSWTIVDSENVLGVNINIKPRS